MTKPLRVGIVGCGLIGRKRAAALGDDELIGCHDVIPEASIKFADEFGGKSCRSLDDLFDLKPDVVVVATIHSDLSSLAVLALESGAHVLVEKPAGRCYEDVAKIEQAAKTAGRLVKVGFNHRFHPAIHRSITEALSGQHGDIMFARARYGHGGRLGYESEWRADPALSGGGEIVDQGMHLLDLFYWLFGPLPVSGSLLRTQFWDAPVDDNAVLILGERGSVGCRSPWALMHVSWTEWKNLFSLEITCRQAKFEIEGLARSYGPQKLKIHRMRPDLGPPDTETVLYPDRDVSWENEWNHFAQAVRDGFPQRLLGDLASAMYAWTCIQNTTE